MAVAAKDQVCRIAVDTFERRSGVVEALAASGVEVEIGRLPVGDYDVGNGVLVERKTVADLHLSIERGRLWRQIGALRRLARLPYLLIEGPELDAGPIAPAAVRGACLAVIGQGVPVLPTRDPADSALWLRLLAGRVNGVPIGRDRPAYAQRLKPTSELVKEAVLAAVPGISVGRARALLERFGSVAGIVSAGYDEWIKVPGIGPVNGEALRRALS